MAEPAKYLYCVIPGQGERTFEGAAIGTEDGAVYTVPQNGLAAVVSDTPLKHYESTRKNMMAHEKVMESVMGETALLPVRFCTIADSPSPLADIRRLLSSRSAEFLGLLKEMEGRVELGLKAFWRDEQAIFEEIVAENGDIRRLRDSLSGRPPEATHFDRVRLGEMVKEALNRKRARKATEIMLPLRHLACRVRENEVLADRMVVNAAFLVDREREPEFDQLAVKLDAQLGEQVLFKYMGPVPPYNFVNIVVNWQELSG